MQKPLMALIAIVIIGAAVSSYFYKKNSSAVPESHTVACTQEAKMCPDGSSVGRTGPNCEFAACPTTATPTKPGTTPKPTNPVTPTETVPTNTGVARYGEKIMVQGVSLTPMVVSDDRCPSDAVCASPGEFSLQTRVVSNGVTSDQFFKLGKPIDTKTETITLLYVSPVPKMGEPVGSNQYRFTFEVVKK